MAGQYFYWFGAGRKRMHLELKETMTRMGTDIKQKVLDR
jgi:hypothetical protein